MCNCIERFHEELEAKGTTLVTTLLSQPPRVVLATYYSGPKKRGAKAAIVLASYCPFCGEKYPKYEDIFTSKPVCDDGKTTLVRTL